MVESRRRVSRVWIAKRCGIGFTATTDEGIGGLFDRPHGGGAPRKLTSAQESEVTGWVHSGPDPGTDGVVRWRRSDLGRKIAQTFGVHLHERSVGKLLHRLGFRHLSVRPRHPQADSSAQEAHKKTLPHWSLTPSRRGPRQADRALVAG